jgi:hypothetical protein
VRASTCSPMPSAFTEGCCDKAVSRAGGGGAVVCVCVRGAPPPPVALRVQAEGVCAPVPVLPCRQLVLRDVDCGNSGRGGHNGASASMAWLVACRELVPRSSCSGSSERGGHDASSTSWCLSRSVACGQPALRCICVAPQASAGWGVGVGGQLLSGLVTHGLWSDVFSL